MLSVALFEPPRYREYLTGESNCKGRGMPRRTKVMIAMFSESSLIIPIGTHHVDFLAFKVSALTRREGNPFTVR